MARDSSSLRQVHRHSAALTLVVASLASAVAAVSGLTGWVPAVAALVALVSGWRTITAEVLQPRRRTALGQSVVQVTARRSNKSDATSNAFCIGPGIWATTGYAVMDRTGQVSQDIRLKAVDGYKPAQLICDVVSPDQLVTLRAEEPRRPALRLGPNFLLVNDPVAMSVTWSTVIGGEVQDRHLTVEYKFLGFSSVIAAPAATDKSMSSDLPAMDFIALSGPLPHDGTAGAPIMDIRSGRVVGALAQVDYKAGALATAFAIPVRQAGGGRRLRLWRRRK